MDVSTEDDVDSSLPESSQEATAPAADSDLNGSTVVDPLTEETHDGDDTPSARQTESKKHNRRKSSTPRQRELKKLSIDMNPEVLRTSRRRSSQYKRSLQAAAERKHANDGLQLKAQPMKRTRTSKASKELKEKQRELLSECTVIGQLLLKRPLTSESDSAIETQQPVLVKNDDAKDLKVSATSEAGGEQTAKAHETVADVQTDVIHNVESANVSSTADVQASENYDSCGSDVETQDVANEPVRAALGDEVTDDKCDERLADVESEKDAETTIELELEVSANAGSESEKKPEDAAITESDSLVEESADDMFSDVRLSGTDSCFSEDPLTDKARDGAEPANEAESTKVKSPAKPDNKAPHESADAEANAATVTVPVKDVAVTPSRAAATAPSDLQTTPTSASKAVHMSRAMRMVAQASLNNQAAGILPNRRVNSDPTSLRSPARESQLSFQVYRMLLL